MRVAAIALLVRRSRGRSSSRAPSRRRPRGGAREVVILLDQSASMGYGDHWKRAQDAAHKVVAGLGGDDAATLVLFGRNAEENMRATLGSRDGSTRRSTRPRSAPTARATARR